MNEDKIKQLFNKTIDKMISNPDELFDNYILTKKYNEKLKEIIKLKKQLEEYENMRKEAIKKLKDWEKLDLDNLLVAIRNVENILNKVGGNDE